MWRSNVRNWSRCRPPLICLQSALQNLKHNRKTMEKAATTLKNRRCVSEILKIFMFNKSRIFHVIYLCTITTERISSGSFCMFFLLLFTFYLSFAFTGFSGNVRLKNYYCILKLLILVYQINKKDDHCLSCALIWQSSSNAGIAFSFYLWFMLSFQFHLDYKENYCNSVQTNVNIAKCRKQVFLTLILRSAALGDSFAASSDLYPLASAENPFPWPSILPSARRCALSPFPVRFLFLGSSVPSLEWKDVEIQL